MRLPIIIASVASLTAACATVSQASIEDRTLSYGCSDTVVVGTVKSAAYKPIEDKNDILGHGWITAMVRVRKTVRGTALPANLPVKYFAHTYMRSDKEFMLVLKDSGTGYEITTGRLMRLRPVLANRCE